MDAHLSFNDKQNGWVLSCVRFQEIWNSTALSSFLIADSTDSWIHFLKSKTMMLSGISDLGLNHPNCIILPGRERASEKLRPAGFYPLCLILCSVTVSSCCCHVVGPHCALIGQLRCWHKMYKYFDHTERIEVSDVIRCQIQFDGSHAASQNRRDTLHTLPFLSLILKGEINQSWYHPC